MKYINVEALVREGWMYSIQKYDLFKTIDLKKVFKYWRWTGGCSDETPLFYSY